MDEAPIQARSAKEQFDRQARHYDKRWNSWTEDSLQWLLDHADCRAANVVLDVATGTGFTAAAFAPFVHSVVGTDVSHGMLSQARIRANGLSNVTFQEGDAERLPFPDASFDLVVCRVAAHHFLSVPRFVGEVARVLKQHGRFLLADTSVPNNDIDVADWQNEVETLRDPSHVRNYTPDEWRRFIFDAGLSLELLSDGLGSVAMSLPDWLLKSGCTGETASTVKQRFQSAPEPVTRAFRIAVGPDGDISFTWRRVLLRACAR